MMMPPVNTIVVNTLLLPEDRRDASALGQAKRLLTKALAPVDKALAGRNYPIGAFSAADIMLGHACFMVNRLGCVPDDMKSLKGHVNRAVTVIAPESFVSEMIRVARGNPARVVARTPANRIGRDEDMAGAAIFLASMAGNCVAGD
jgi:glutathione S-transferase